MPLEIDGQKVSDVSALWGNLENGFPQTDLRATAKSILYQMEEGPKTWEFPSRQKLAETLRAAIAPKMRKNYYFQLEGENYNPGKVIHKSKVPTESIGWSQGEFFKWLGDPRHPRCRDENLSSRSIAGFVNLVGQTMSRSSAWQVTKILEEIQDTFVGVLKRRAEQEYIMQSMVKAALYEAALIADEYKVGISVRGTGLLSHMGIESGDPTKAQEFKNKSSKETDLFLCDELKWRDLGSVVHYDPRVEWTSEKAESAAKIEKIPLFSKKPTEADWQRKKWYIETWRIRDLERTVGHRIRLPSGAHDPYWGKIREQFFKRAKEYLAEDRDYRPGGHFAVHCELVGPFIRLRARPGVNMVSDHDLFGFTTGSFGNLTLDTTTLLRTVQIALQKSNTFQAQHGGIWNWQPKGSFHKEIKRTVMEKHTADHQEPLIYVRPGFRTYAAYYVPDDEKLKSVWDCSYNAWLDTTHSGRLVFATPTRTTVVPFVS